MLAQFLVTKLKGRARQSSGHWSKDRISEACSWNSQDTTCRVAPLLLWPVVGPAVVLLLMIVPPELAWPPALDLLLHGAEESMSSISDAAMQWFMVRDLLEQTQKIEPTQNRKHPRVEENSSAAEMNCDPAIQQEVVT